MSVSSVQGVLLLATNRREKAVTSFYLSLEDEKIALINLEAGAYFKIGTVCC